MNPMAITTQRMNVSITAPPTRCPKLANPSAMGPPVAVP